jgi:hypothetical protein
MLSTAAARMKCRSAGGVDAMPGTTKSPARARTREAWRHAGSPADRVRSAHAAAQRVTRSNRPLPKVSEVARSAPANDQVHTGAPRAPGEPRARGFWAWGSCNTPGRPLRAARRSTSIRLTPEGRPPTPRSRAAEYATRVFFLAGDPLGWAQPRNRMGSAEMPAGASVGAEVAELGASATTSPRASSAAETRPAARRSGPRRPPRAPKRTTRTLLAET